MLGASVGPVCNVLVGLQVSAVSAVVNWGMSPKAFIFRNYNHAPGRLSRYPGGSGYKLWEAVRASSAAPGYFREFPLHSDIHQVRGSSRGWLGHNHLQLQYNGAGYQHNYSTMLQLFLFLFIVFIILSLVVCVRCY